MNAPESPMKNCKQCGQPMVSDAAEGLCARCLLSVAIKESDGAQPSPAVGQAGVSPALAGGTPAGPTDGTSALLPDIGDPAEVARRLPQFEILKLLGRGGMGVVYQARQVNLDRIVALKILPPVDALTPDFVERFRREARSLAKLSHPNIVGVHEFGESGGLYFLAMEFVDGANLREVQRARRMTPQEALAVVPKICDALQFAHEEGVVHRDIKPENILIDKRGRVKIADFGLAKLLRRDQADHTLTGTGMTLGTPRYMAPEQLDRPETVDHRADIYSLGVVFYEMLTGEVPMGRFAPPSEKVQIDVKLDEIVLHALERDVERRYQHASEVRTAVETVTSTPQPVAAPAAPPAQPAPGFDWPRAFGALLLGWVVVGLLWNLETPGCVAGVLLMAGIFAEIVLRRARRNPRWRAAWESATTSKRIIFHGSYIISATLSFFYLLSAIMVQWEASPRRWNAVVVSAAEFEARHEGKEHQLIRQLDAFKETVPTTELSRRDGRYSWNLSLWAGSPSLNHLNSWYVASILLAAALVVFLLAQQYFAAEDISIWRWNFRAGYRPAAALTALVVASTVVAYGTLHVIWDFQPGGTVVEAPTKRLTLAATVEQVDAAVTQWAQASGHATGDVSRWVFDTVPQGKPIAQLEIASAWKPSIFARWQMTPFGLRHISPHLAFQILGTDQPAQSIVTISTGGRMAKDSPEWQVWERELAGAAAALEQAGKIDPAKPDDLPASGEAGKPPDHRGLPLWAYLCGVVGTSVVWASIRVTFARRSF